jgi:hypothetical protein
VETQFFSTVPCSVVGGGLAPHLLELWEFEVCGSTSSCCFSIYRRRAEPCRGPVLGANQSWEEDASQSPLACMKLGQTVSQTPGSELDFLFSLKKKKRFYLKNYVLDLFDLYECFFPSICIWHMCVCLVPRMSGEGLGSSGAGATDDHGSPGNPGLFKNSKCS